MRILAIYLILMNGFVFSQYVIQWEPEINVADGSIYGNLRPRLALTLNDTPVVLFGKSSNGALSTARFNGVSFDSPILIHPPDVDTYLASWTGPDIASKGNLIVAVFKALPLENGHIYTVRSEDGGITWSDTIRTDSHLNGGMAWMPSMDMDENGNPSITYMAHDIFGTSPRYYVTHSNDLGVSYLSELDIAAAIADEACDCCPAEYVIQDNQHALLFRNNDANIRDIYAVYSEDDGSTYPQNTNVDNLAWLVNSCPSTGPHGIFNNGKLITTYSSRVSGASRIYITETATSPSLTFENRSMMTPPLSGSGIQNYPRISGQNDTIVLVWQESETSNNEIYSAISTNGNLIELLSSKSMVNTFTTGNQTNPDVKYANGKVHIVYQDSQSGDVIYRKGNIEPLGLLEKESLAISVFPNPGNGGKFILKGEHLAKMNFHLTNAIGETCQYSLVQLENDFVLVLNTDQKGIFYLTGELNGIENTIMLVNE